MHLHTILKAFAFSLSAVSVVALSLPERRSDIHAREFSYPLANFEELTPASRLPLPPPYLSLSVPIIIAIIRHS
jgi:hypothetical protein